MTTGNFYYYSGVCGQTKCRPNRCVLKCPNLQFSQNTMRYYCAIGQMRGLEELNITEKRRSRNEVQMLDDRV